MTPHTPKTPVAGHDAVTEQERLDAIATREKIKSMYYPAKGGAQ